jgi:hypothetical protein
MFHGRLQITLDLNEAKEPRIMFSSYTSEEVESLGYEVAIPIEKDDQGVTFRSDNFFPRYSWISEDDSWRQSVAAM